MRTLHVKWELRIKPDVILPEIWLDDVIMTGFFLSLTAFFSAVLKPIQDPVEQGKGVCTRRQNHGTAGQALVIHGRDIMVLNTLEEVCLLAFVLLEDQGSHLPGHAGTLSETALLSTLGLFNFYKFFFDFLPCCLAIS